MKQLLILLATVFLHTIINAQSKAAKIPSMPAIDVNAIRKMTPAELEAYKKKMIEQSSAYAEKSADENKLSINKALIPGAAVKPPVKQTQKLAAIPVYAPTKAELLSKIEGWIVLIQKGMIEDHVKEVTAMITSKSSAEIQQFAVTEFYFGNKQKGMLSFLHLAKKSPDDLLYLNNLGAIFNLTGVMHKAIPLFQYCLEKNPVSATVLGNMGQSYLALGDLTKAEYYLTKCLDIDSMHIEANHSMGMIYAFNNQPIKAKACFARELKGCPRNSSIATAEKLGFKFSARKIIQDKRSATGMLNKDFIEEITQNKFKLPDFPNSVKELTMYKHEYESMAASYAAEFQYWMKKSLEVSNNYANSGDEMPGIYHEHVKEALKELDEEYTSDYLNNFTQSDFNTIKEIVALNTKLLVEHVCEKVPAGSTIEVQEAYAIKCCEKHKRPLADIMLNQIGEQISRIYGLGQLRWKKYLNEMLSIAEMDPGPANQMMMYNGVANYFNYLSTAMIYYSSEITNYLPKCVENYDPNSFNRVMESNRLWNLTCPPGFNVEAGFFGAAIKVDCNKLAIEGGSTLMGGFELDFKSKQSTLLLGPGIKGDVFGIVNGEVKTQFYLTFDEYLHYQDFGVKRTAELAISGTPIPLAGDKISIGGNLAGIEISDKIGISSGYSGTEVEWKGAAAWYVNWLNSK